MSFNRCFRFKIIIIENHHQLSNINNAISGNPLKDEINSKGKEEIKINGLFEIMETLTNSGRVPNEDSEQGANLNTILN